ncbi:MAG: phosphotransferase [Eggerthellaceae bacterium]|nr:phosphotransferase [Eggerthellaceae bacterium]
MRDSFEGGLEVGDVFAAYLRGNAELRAAIGAPEGAVLEPHYLGAGEHNRNFWFVEPASGRKYVLRVNVISQPFHDDQVSYEFAALKALAPSGCTPEPIYLDSPSATFEKGAMVIGFCEGDELNLDALRPGDLHCVAQLMADVHAVPVSGDCTLFRPADPLRALYDECIERFETYYSSAYEDARLTKWARWFIDAAKPMLDAPANPDDCAHIINTEPLPSHFLIAEAAQAGKGHGQISAAPGFYIDWERAIVGEPAQDVAYFTAPTTTFWDGEHIMTAAEENAFVEDYWRAVDGRFERGNFDKRYRAYRAMTALRSVTWCCRALIQYGKDSQAHQTSKTAAKLPIYLSDDFMHLVAEQCFA